MKTRLETEQITRDRDIRAALLPMLRSKYLHAEGDIAWEEFPCNRARVDVAVLNGVMHAFEIKSDSDSISRLEDQLAAYHGVFDLVTVVVGKRLLCAVQAVLPAHCGLLLARRLHGTVRLTHIQKARRHTFQRTIDLARVLLKDEALSLLRSRGLKQVNTRSSASAVSHAVASSFKLEELATEVRLAIKARLNCAIAQQFLQDDDLSTTEPIVLLDHYSRNLEQLLSVLSPDHHD